MWDSNMVDRHMRDKRWRYRHRGYHCLLHRYRRYYSLGNRVSRYDWFGQVVVRRSIIKVSMITTQPLCRHNSRCRLKWLALDSVQWEEYLVKRSRRIQYTCIQGVELTEIRNDIVQLSEWVERR